MGTVTQRRHGDADRKVLAVLQPGYLPWLGFFDLLDRADVFVIYDDVAFDKNGWRNRNRIKTSQGISWLTVPVLTTGRSGQLICDVIIDEHQIWAKKHIRSIREAYARAPYFERYFAALEELLGQPWQRLVDLDMAVIHLMASWLGLDQKQIVQSSGLNVAGERNDRLIEICEHFHATTYVSGNLAKDYLDVTRFEQRAVTVEWQDYLHPVYDQLHGPFESHLSALDLVFNSGPQSLDVIRRGSAKIDLAMEPEAHP